jgi:hypothetical protein
MLWGEIRVALQFVFLSSLLSLCQWFKQYLSLGKQTRWPFLKLQFLRWLQLWMIDNPLPGFLRWHDLTSDPTWEEMSAWLNPFVTRGAPVAHLVLRNLLVGSYCRDWSLSQEFRNVRFIASWAVFMSYRFCTTVFLISKSNAITGCS